MVILTKIDNPSFAGTPGGACSLRGNRNFIDVSIADDRAIETEAACVASYDARFNAYRTEDGATRRVAASAMSFARSASYRARPASTSISSEMSRFDWPNRIAPPLVCAMFHCRSSVSVFTGADGPSVASHLLKSRFIPYLSATEQL